MLNDHQNEGFYQRFKIPPWMVIIVLFAGISAGWLQNRPVPKAIGPAESSHEQAANDGESRHSNEALPDESEPALPELTSDSAHSGRSAHGNPVGTSNEVQEDRSFIIQNQVIRGAHGQIVHRGAVDLTPTLDRIRRGESDRHHHDGTEFQNRERRLPGRSAGYYKEYVHHTAGIDGPGPQRVILGRDGDIWYTPDHYRTFIEVKSQK